MRVKIEYILIIKYNLIYSCDYRYLLPNTYLLYHKFYYYSYLKENSILILINYIYTPIEKNLWESDFKNWIGEIHCRGLIED